MGPEELRQRPQRLKPHQNQAAGWVTYCGRSLDKGYRSRLDRLQAHLLKPHQSKTAACAISLGRGLAIKFPRAASRAQFPTDTGGQAVPGGDILAQIMRELAKAIEEGRLKPVVVGPVEIGIPGQAGPAGQTQAPMGGIFGQILRDLLGGKGGQLQQASLANGMGSAVFGDRLEPDLGVKQTHIESLHEVLDRFSGFER